MLISDFLASQAIRPDDLAWMGDALPHHPAFETMPMAGPDKSERVCVLTVEAARLAGPAQARELLDILTEADDDQRWVLLGDFLPAEPVARQLAADLAGVGYHLLHAVCVDDAASIGVASALSVQRLGVGNPADSKVDETEPNWELLRTSFLNVAAAYERARRVPASPDSRPNAQLAQAERRIAALQSSATMRVGQAVVLLARNPVRNASRCVRLLREGWRAHRAASNRTPPIPRQATPPPTTPAGPLPERLDFMSPVPTRPGDQAPAPPLHIDVPSAHVVARMLRRDGVGGYEPAMMSWFLALCDTAGPGDVWDVGANLGIYGLLARRCTQRAVVGFEPTPDLAFWGRHLARTNDADYRLEQLAAGEHAGVATFYIADQTDSSNSLAAGFRASSRHMDVLVEPLDRYHERTGSVPAIMKVDTETTEHLVLRGAERVLATHRPWVFCEVLAGRAPERHLTSIMRAHGYRFFHLDGSYPLAEQDSVVGDPTCKHMNYLFAPEALDEPTLAAAASWRDALAETPRSYGRPSSPGDLKDGRDRGTPNRRPATSGRPDSYAHQ